MTATLPPDTDPDFEDIDALVAEALCKQSDKQALLVKQKRLAAISGRKSGDAELERQALTAAIRRLEESIVWTTVGCVALFDSQHCANCGSTHTVFVGWMTLQKHKHVNTCVRLLAGKPIEPLPVTRNEHWHRVPLCIDCFGEDHA